MSLTPEPTGTETAPEKLSVPLKRPRRWPLVCLFVITFAIGGFLVVFPWTDAWDLNSMPEIIPRASDFWDEPSFRGALTGLGFLNLYVAAAQIAHVFRRRR